jgi:hypothetical protein
MHDLLDQRLQTLARHRRFQRVLRRWLPLCAVSFAAAAGIIMVVRLAVPDGAWLIMPLVALAACVPLIGIPRWFAERDQPALLAGHLDTITNGQGIIMALSATPSAQRDGDWLARVRVQLENCSMPTWEWPHARAVFLALLCLAVAVFIPQRTTDLTMPRMVAAFFASTAERIDTLAQANIIPDDIAEQQRLDLERLKNQAIDQGMNQALWDGLDRLQQRVEKDAENSVERLAQALSTAQMVTQTQQDQVGQQQQVALAQAVAELAFAAPGLLPNLPPGADRDALGQALAAAVQNGALTKEQAGALQKLGLINPGMKPQLDQKRLQELSKKLEEQLDKMCEKMGQCKLGSRLGQALARCQGEGPGRGGVNRGPGHVELTWEDKLRTEGGGIEALPTGVQLNPDGSVTIAEQIRDAEIDPALHEAATRAALRQFDPTAADAKRATVAPRHRDIVERYFAAEQNAPARGTAPAVIP